jgi:hypothetical protein
MLVSGASVAITGGSLLVAFASHRSSARLLAGR